MCARDHCGQCLVEGFDCQSVFPLAGQDLTQVLKRGRISEGSWSRLVELGGIPEVIDGLTPYAATVSEGRPAGKKTRVLFGARPLGQRHRVNRELLVADPGCNSN